jgi:ankyrin repeat protein
VTRIALAVRRLTDSPDLDQLKRQAKELLADFRAGHPAAVAEVNARYQGATAGSFALSAAQLVLARSYGFDSWPKLKAFVDGASTAALCDAVIRRDFDTVRSLLDRRPEIVNFERPEHSEMRALHGAVLARDAEMTRLLMSRGADARVGIYPNRTATTCFTIATERGYGDIVAIIQEEERRRQAAHVADDGSASEAGLPEELFDLRWWQNGRALEFVKLHPERVHSSSAEGWRPIHIAAAMLDEPAVSLILSNGADVNTKGKGDWTPLGLAASGRGWLGGAGVPEFRRVADVLIHAGAEMTPLAAVALGDAAWVRARHAEGRLTNATMLDVFGPFAGLVTAAVRHDRPEMLRILLDLGLDPDERVRLIDTDDAVESWSLPLYLCVSMGKRAMAELLLDHGADPNGDVYASGSPTFVSYQRGDQAMIALLERHGGELDASAVGYFNKVDLAKRMLDGTANPRLPAGRTSKEDLAKMLVWSGASGGDPDIVRLAIPHLDWAAGDPRWFELLWRPIDDHSDAERPAYLECLRVMLSRSGPEVRDERFGRTILHEAIARCPADGILLATILLDAGARLDVRDNLLESTPLGWACRWGRIEAVKLLLARGADPVESAAEPWATPRAWAEKGGHREILVLLPPG